MFPGPLLGMDPLVHTQVAQHERAIFVHSARVICLKLPLDLLQLLPHLDYIEIYIYIYYIYM